MKHRDRVVRINALAALLITGCIAVTPNAISAQSPYPAELVNGGMEDATSSGQPQGWFFAAPPNSGMTSGLDTADPFAGDRCAVVDSTNRTPGQNPQSFSNLMQVINGEPYRGKRVRFRAAVKTAALEGDGRAQLWFRVDRPPKDGQPQMGAFDNMQNRPIRNDEWQHHEIVLQIDDDADRIIVGLLMLDVGKAWIDDATFEVVSDDTPTTEMQIGATRANDNGASARSPRTRGLTANVFREAAESPPQPFFTHWLWLPLVGFVLLALSQRVRRDDSGNSIDPGFAAKFGVRFAVAYWLLYSLPAPFASLISSVVPQAYRVFAWYNDGVDLMVRWTASSVLGIEGELVAPNGSGDTTYAYVKVLIGFVLALMVALLWSIADRRTTDYRCAKDLIRSYVRYVLAFTMLGYGLAKVGWAYNQFPEPDASQLMKSYGDSSPMNLVWTFMGASRPYTIFSGLGEVAGALLLIWRRTTTLGALVVFGVMLNVMMLNFCYDVPVKQYSAHLIGMATFLLLGDAGRLAAVLLRNRSTHKVDLRPPYVGQKTIWVQLAVKAAIIGVGIAMPIWNKVDQELEHARQVADVPDFFGSWEVSEFRRNDEVVEPVLTDVTRWRTVTFRQRPFGPGGTPGTTDYMTVGLMNSGMAGGIISISDDQSVITVESGGSTLVPAELTMTRPDDDSMELSGTTPAGRIAVRLLRRDREDFLLMGRGFRWINEVPFNR